MIKPIPVVIVPKIITFLGPNLSIAYPTNGDINPLSLLWIEIAAPVAAALHPKVPKICGTKAWNPRQNTADVYHWTIPPAPTIYQP